MIKAGGGGPGSGTQAGAGVGVGRTRLVSIKVWLLVINYGTIVSATSRRTFDASSISSGVWFLIHAIKKYKNKKTQMGGKTLWLDLPC